MFNFSTKKFSHPFQSSKFTVVEILNDTPRFETYMQTLANQLNSNESFDVNDEFQVDMKTVTVPEAGGRSKGILGKRKFTSVLRHNRCVLPIVNYQDDLCLARAICLTKAHYHKDDDRESLNYYKKFRKHPMVFTRCATHLHREAGVSEGHAVARPLKSFKNTWHPTISLNSCQ